MSKAKKIGSNSITGLNNTSLNLAKKAKQDEFYTKYEDIAEEIDKYIEYNTAIDLFKDKTVLLPCDDPTWSKFTKYFVDNFHNFGLKKLISTSIGKTSSTEDDKEQISLFDDMNTKGKEEKGDSDFVHGKILIIERGGINDVFSVENESDVENKNNVNSVDIDSLHWEYLKGDGDFRSEEVSRLRDEADLIFTNPPFSLFREFVDWVNKSKKDVKFAILGTVNAVAYKNTFALLKDNNLWIGHETPTFFTVPADFEVTESLKRVVDGQTYQRFGNIYWFTNIDHARRHNVLALKTMEENLLHNKRIADSKYAYKKYDNYDAIEVPLSVGIPLDYNGIMGVPLSFLTKYNPKQFEIVKLGTEPIIDGVKIYKRVLIKHKK